VKALVVLALLAVPAYAERPLHGSVGVGSSLIAAGAQGDHQRFELEADLEPHSRYGGLLAWRGFDDSHHGWLVGGLMFEPGAARPLLVVDLHADAGFDLDQKAPLAGGGIRTTLTIWKMIGVALDGFAYAVIDGVDNSRLVVAGSSSLVARW
jgi:hypothetical protein